VNCEAVMDLREVARDKTQLSYLVKAVMVLWFPQK
jgi:hypothetical protein